MQKLFLTFFYTGLMPKAPGTAGTIAGAVVAYIILQFFSIETLMLLTIFISIISIDVINKYEKKSGIHDNQIIVIDEVAGVWLAICLSLSVGIVQILLCVIFFRIFDITKPSIIGKIDKHVKGGLGVMGDDLVAGIVAGILASASWQFLVKFVF